MGGGGSLIEDFFIHYYQTEWMKETGDLWAKRPMTEDMILYAAGDVIAIVPEVYENQKR